MKHWLLVIAVWFTFTPLAIAQDDDDDDDEDQAATPGLVALYESGGKSVRRVDADVAATWEGGPDQRLPAGEFSATWSADLLIQQSGDYRFHAFVDGRVQVEVAGVKVLDGRGEDTWVDSKLTPVGFGEQPVTVRYQSRPTGDGMLKLFWSSDKFSMEPIPSHLFSFAEAEPALLATSNAARWHNAHRCARCHTGSQFAATDPGPALDAIRGAMSESWFTQKLMTAPKVGGSSRMPHFGFDESQAADIAAFVFSGSKKPKTRNAAASKNKQNDIKAGRRLISTLGCLACHRLEGIGPDGAYSGGDLSQVAGKRSTAWVHTWLANPDSLNTDHRMPVFKLSKDERRQLALALGGEPTAAPKKASAEQIARGKLLATKSGCANCHRITGLKVSPLDVSGNSSCLDPTAEHVGPRFPQIEDALSRSIAEWHRSVVSPPSAFHSGQQLLARRNCTACHQRDGATGILPVVSQLIAADSSLRADSQGLIPPALTAVGDKLKDDALAEAIAGKQKKVRLPWLSVRMPKFEHSKTDAAALLAHLIEHDRIPDRADDTALPIAQTNGAGPSAKALVAGQQLIGSGGFSCIACHTAGKYAPRNLALGTRGSDLLMPGERMRKEYFLRWTRSPSRIVPGMEMPSITRAVKGVLHDDIHQQLAATWDALNDKNFTVPTNTASFEQFVQVPLGAPARMIRDVFTDPVTDAAIPRPLAIGLNNGHNVMFDLDQFGLRHWWFGDTARQRTEGKSWYWDVAGIVLGSQPTGPDVVLLAKDGAIVGPTEKNATTGRLLNWYPTPDGGVSFGYLLDFTVNKSPVQLMVLERIEPYTLNNLQGWRRTIAVGDAPTGHKVAVRLMKHSAETELQVDVRRTTVIDDQGYLRFVNGTAQIGFLSSLERGPVKTRAKPEITSNSSPITSVPGFDGVRLPLTGSIMPTSMLSRSDGTLVFTSLKGHVFVAKDKDGDGLHDTLVTFEEGLAAPFGILEDGKSLLVAHKPEIIRLTDKDGDDRADFRTVMSTGWGYSDNYHDWTCGLVRDSTGNVYFGLGSDYAQPKRPKERSLWRGAVLRLTREGETEPVSWSFRYPVGFAIDNQDRVFVTDNQGVQNTFNEINHIEMGKHYGVPSRHEPNPDESETTPAIRVPHPWVRSMNGLAFLPRDHASPFGGHLIGCEYDTHLLVRMSFQTVDGVVQGASYYLSRPGLEGGGSNFVGPMCATVAGNGDVFIGSIHDSGWLGGQNTGAIERLRFNKQLPNGIKEVRATADGFEVELIRKVSPDVLRKRGAFTVSAYTRKWGGSYATPDSGRHDVPVSAVEMLPDGRTARLIVGKALRAEHVYEVTIGGAVEAMFPATGHYTMKRVPAK